MTSILISLGLAAVLMTLTALTLPRYMKVIRARIEVEREWRHLETVIDERQLELARLSVWIEEARVPIGAGLDPVREAQAAWLVAPDEAAKLQAAAMLSASVLALVEVIDALSNWPQPEGWSSYRGRLQTLEQVLKSRAEEYNAAVLAHQETAARLAALSGRSALRARPLYPLESPETTVERKVA